MITYRFTAHVDGMFVKTYTDVGWIAHLNCAGDMSSEYTVPYVDGKASVWFGHPYCVTVVGNAENSEVGLEYNHSASPITKHYEGSTFVLQLDRQPSMKCEITNVRRN